VTGGSRVKLRRTKKCDAAPVCVPDIDLQDAQYLVLDAGKAFEEIQRNWTVMDHIRRLPEKLPMLYMRLTH
jgi:hypothetical protein